MVGSRRAKRHRTNHANDTAPTIASVSPTTPRPRKDRRYRRSARLSRRPFHRNPDDFGAHAARETEKYCSGAVSAESLHSGQERRLETAATESFGHQRTSHEQT